MMCRVVTDPLLPLHGYAPREPLSAGEPTHNVQDIIPNILKEPLIYENRRDFIENVEEGAVRAGLASLFNIDFASTSAEGISLQSEKLKRYSLNNPEQIFEELMNNKDYARDVRKLLKKTTFGRAYLVVGFLTTEGSIWTQSQTRKTRFGFKVTLPVSETLGGPAVADPKVDASVSGASRQGLHMHVVKEEIFAVAYDVVKTSYRVDGQGRRVKIGRPLQTQTRLHFGDDSDSTSSDSSDDDDIAFVKGDVGSSEEEHGRSRLFDLETTD